MANSQNTVREIIVGTGVTVPAETTLATFKATATAGEIAVFSADGSAAAAGKDCKVFLKTATGVIASDVIEADKASFTIKATAAEVPKIVEVSTITVPATAGTIADYTVEIIIRNWGSLSPVNFYTKFGHFRLTQTSGPLTAEAVVDGLIANLNANFSKVVGATSVSNPFFTFAKSGSGASAKLVITAKAQDIELGKFEGRPLEFDVLFKSETQTAAVTVTQAANPGIGTGKQIATLEYFYKGNRGDVNRFVGFPYTWPQDLKASTATSYDVIDITHYVEGDGLNQLKLPKQILIACPNNATNDVADALRASLNTVFGTSVAVLSA